jgi:hypothetical protein
MIESRVTPGNTKSYKRGVKTFFFPVNLSFNTKNMFELPTYPTLSLKSQRTC